MAAAAARVWAERVVATADQGRTLARVLAGRQHGLAVGLVHRLLRQRLVRVNGARVAPAHRVVAGDRIALPPFVDTHAPHAAAVSAAPPRVSVQDAAELQRAVLYADDDVLVLNKPHGLATQGARAHTQTQRQG
jgi:23S rRNA pseudouridine955/2504/2580 synthase